jgi:retinol dehydrogenase-12
MGTLLSLAKQTFVANPKYSVEDIPDLSGQVIVVTGANAGIGKETAKVSFFASHFICKLAVAQ